MRKTKYTVAAMRSQADDTRCRLGALRSQIQIIEYPQLSILKRAGTERGTSLLNHREYGREGIGSKDIPVVVQSGVAP